MKTSERSDAWAFFSDFWTLWTTFQKEHVKTKLREEGSKNKDQGSAKSRRRRVLPEKASSKLGRRLAPRPRAGEQFRCYNNNRFTIIYLNSTLVFAWALIGNINTTTFSCFPQQR